MNLHTLPTIMLSITLLAACGGGGDEAPTPETTASANSAGTDTGTAGDSGPSSSAAGPAASPTPPSDPPDPATTVYTPIYTTSPVTPGVTFSRFALVRNPMGSPGFNEYFSNIVCVKDNTTGLTWEGKFPRSDEGRIYESVNQFTNYDNLTHLQVPVATGPTGDGVTNWRYPTERDLNMLPSYRLGISGNTTAYVNRLNTNNHCGYSNWRVPTTAELGTLLDRAQSPMINGTWFPNTMPGRYWTVNDRPETWRPYTEQVHYAEGVDFRTGTIGGSYTRSSGHYLRLVRN